jgi:hypothetical protein
MALDDESLNAIAGLHDEKAVAGFVYLTGRLLKAVRIASRTGAIAYVETEYFGAPAGRAPSRSTTAS